LLAYLEYKGYHIMSNGIIEVFVLLEATPWRLLSMHRNFSETCSVPSSTMTLKSRRHLHNYRCKNVKVDVTE